MGKKKNKLGVFTFYFYNGKKDICPGMDPEDAVYRAGYPVYVADPPTIWFEGVDNSLIWDKDLLKWVENGGKKMNSTKSLFKPNTLEWTPEANDLANEIDAALYPIFLKWCIEKEHSPREVSYVANFTASSIDMRLVLDVFRRGKK